MAAGSAGSRKGGLSPRGGTVHPLHVPGHAHPGCHRRPGNDTQAIADGDTQIVNALSLDQFGDGRHPLGRPGRIPNSLSVPATDLLHPLTGDFATPEQMAQQLAAVDPRSR